MTACLSAHGMPTNGPVLQLKVRGNVATELKVRGNGATKQFCPHKFLIIFPVRLTGLVESNVFGIIQVCLELLSEVGADVRS